ncbi:MAG: murein biosynthesis integral membrane protein MurJ [Wenzhouxiangellaceae bacterium]
MVSFGTLLSRLLGFIRDMVIARVFGAGGATDAFFVAFRIPNFLRRLFAEGSFSLAFVPVFSAYREQGDQRGLKELLDAVTGSLLAVLLLITGLGVFAAGAVISVFAPGFLDQPEQFTLARDLLRITFPYLLLISLTALAGGVLNTMGRFFVPAVTPVLLNIALISAALLGAPYFEQPVTALAWGVLAAGVAQLLLQIPVLMRLQLLPRPRWGWAHAGVRRIAKLMLPTLFGSSVAQINLLFDTLLASLLVSGSVTWLYYADRLLEFPLGVFGVALATVILPTLSRRVAAGDRTAEQATLAWALRWSWLISVPAAVGLGVLAKALLVSLFAYQAFTPADAGMAAWALTAYAGGLPAFILIKALAPAYYARQDTATPVRIGVMAMLLNMGLNLVFITLLAYYLSPQPDSGWLEMLAAAPGAHAGLALASAASAWLNAGLLWRGLKQRQQAPAAGALSSTLWRVLCAAALMLAALLLTPASWWPQVADHAGQRVFDLIRLVALGAMIYFLALWVLRLPLNLLRSPSAAS